MASSVFLAKLVTGGGISATCDFCGRFHFCTDVQSYDYEDGELARLQTLAEKEPDKYIQHEYSIESSILIEKRCGVIDCPCNWADRYEAWILSHSDFILEYLAKAFEYKLDEAYKKFGAVQKAQQAKVPKIKRALRLQ